MVQGPTLDDLRKQLNQVRAGGIEGLQGLTEMTPEDRHGLERTERILEAMTEEERTNGDLLLDEQVRRRVACQSGTELRAVEDLISQVAKVRLMMEKLLPRKS